MTEKTPLKGLSMLQVKKLQEQYGKNVLTPQKKIGFLHKLLHIISEPMFLLLIAASVIYFILGEPRDGAVMLLFVLGIISIDVIQEWKTDKTLRALHSLSAPHIKVIREGEEQEIESEDLVPGDLMLIQEGVKIPADGVVLRGSDLRVDESSLTGEAEGVWKVTTEEGEASSSDYWRKDYCYAGTLVVQGSGTVRVEKTGPSTEYGKIGQHVATAPERPTPLQIQTNSLVKRSAGIAAMLFVLVGVITYINIPDHAFGARMIESILSGITLAMAMIPEEFPVVLTVFLSLGAWRLAKKNSLIRRLPSVETLGAVSVLCVDKTGTITMNRMRVQEIWAADCTKTDLCETMGLGCEPDTYDPMEKAMLDYCTERGISQAHLFSGTMLKEYSFTNELKMMGHVWLHDGTVLVAAKGSPERILGLCNLPAAKKREAEEKVLEMAAQGLRVIAVGKMFPATEAEIPAELTDCRLTFCGLVGLEDPPRESIKKDIAVCTQAGIRVVMITGDNGTTAGAIAKKIGMPGSDRILTGDRIEAMSEEELRKAVRRVNIFSRVVPQHKMRIVQAFRENGEIVAMTGDGVNDAPALKYADIGIAMGKRGSEVSREAADLILLDDNFSTIVETIEDGRKIYDNIRKAIGYIFSIHIPIALASLFAPLLHVVPANLMLLPLHIVLLELLIDPTCSIVLERQPAEPDTMHRKPRDPKEKIVTAGSLLKSIAQGIILFAASFGAYYALLSRYLDNAPLARTMGLSILIFSNLFLVQVNTSEHAYTVQSVLRLAHDKVMWAAHLLTIGGLLALLYTPLGGYLKLTPLSAGQFFAALGIAAAAVFWYDLVKLIRNIGKKKQR